MPSSKDLLNLVQNLVGKGHGSFLKLAFPIPFVAQSLCLRLISAMSLTSLPLSWLSKRLLGSCKTTSALVHNGELKKTCARVGYHMPGYASLFIRNEFLPRADKSYRETNAH